MLKNIVRSFILVNVVLLLAVRCASLSPPTGGPKDTIPPLIVRTSPKPYSTNFNGKKIVLEFNEFIALRDQQKYFFISPQYPQKPVLLVKGRSLEITLEKELDSATTHRLDFGNSIVDNNEGNALRGFSFVFSTGDVIDSLMMAGQVIDAYTRDTVVDAFIMYYDSRDDSQEIDSTVFNARAAALFRADSSGFFIADILKDKSYRIYALSDQNNNQKYEPGEDLVAFSDTTYNPTLLPGFYMEFDTLNRLRNIEGLQVVFEVFKEVPVRRQVLSKVERPMRQKLLLTFNATEAVIDTLDLSGIDTAWLLRETNRLGDSITLWINPPKDIPLEAIPDTITGRIVYQRHDSVWNYYTYSHKISPSLIYRKPVDKKEEKQLQKAKKKRLTRTQRRRLRQIRRQYRGMNADSILRAEIAAQRPDTTTTPPVFFADSASVAKKEDQTLVAEASKNPFKFSTNTQGDLIPVYNLVFTFEYPVLEVDTASIKLDHVIAESANSGNRRNILNAPKTQSTEDQKTEPVPFSFSPVDGNPRIWMLKADWITGDNYSLEIPAGAIGNIAREVNDTLQSKFKVATPDKFSTIIIETKADSTLEASYIFEVISGGKGRGSMERRITGVKAGETVTVNYIKPGDYTIRVIEDRNHNAVWDTGVLTLRIQPERVRVWVQGDNDRRLTTKENWELPITVDLKELFSKP